MVTVDSNIQNVNFSVVCLKAHNVFIPFAKFWRNSGAGVETLYLNKHMLHTFFGVELKFKYQM